MAAANSLQKVSSQLRVARSTLDSFSRTFSSDALVEVKPGEVGMVSGIPEEHLRRRVKFQLLPCFRKPLIDPLFFPFNL